MIVDINLIYSNLQEFPPPIWKKQMEQIIWHAHPSLAIHRSRGVNPFILGVEFSHVLRGIYNIN
jgi:hypothetical protein